MDRLLVVSNRLPVTLSRENGAWTYKRSSGGLVAGLAGMKKMTSFIWIGWPGLSHIDLIFLGFEIPEEDRDQIGETLLSEYSAIPVFLPDEISNPFYNTFANSILWPLFHYLPVDMSFDESAWEAYVKANSLFADVILKECRDNDLVWIHDYQLMTLPRLLRMKLDLSGFKNVKIGFFHHIPFPSSEVFRVLPVGACILKGIIAADLIGFHTYEYGRHFLSSCNRLLSLATSPTMVRVSDGHIARVGIYPIGIDPDPFIDALDLPPIKSIMKKLKLKYGDQKIILGVDRLDYIKGIPHKLLGFEIFLRNYPQFRGKVTLVQVAVPTREDVEEYRNLIAYTNALVGHINGKYGSIDYMPLQFINNSVPFQELAALYAIADVCLVTSIRDGMNLVSYEFVAAQPHSNPGVLILSEFAGAAQSFNGALIINPWDTIGLAKTIVTALEMPLEARETAHQSLFRWVTKYTSAYWGMGFISELSRCTQIEASGASSASSITIAPSFRAMGTQKDMQIAFVDSIKKQMSPQKIPKNQLELLLVDKGGKLLEHRPILAKETPRPHMIHLISSLASLPNFSTFIMSGGGRPFSFLLDWFGSTGAGLVDSEGEFYQHPHASPSISNHDDN